MNRRNVLLVLASIAVGAALGISIFALVVLKSCRTAIPDKIAISPQERDYSSAANRLIGKWADAALTKWTDGRILVSQECDYYGPIDQATHQGDFIRYRMEKPDAKTTPLAWSQVRFKYKILSEDVLEHRVTVVLLFEDGEARNESYYIEPNGLTLDRRTLLSRGLGESNTRMLFLARSPGPCDVN